MAKIKATQREATQRDGSLADIPAGVCTKFLTFMQDQIPTFVAARAALQEVVDGDTPVDSLSQEWWVALQEHVKETHSKLNAWRILSHSYKSAKKAQEKAKAKAKSAPLPPPPKMPAAPAASAAPKGPPPPAGPEPSTGGEGNVAVAD